MPKLASEKACAPQHDPHRRALWPAVALTALACATYETPGARLGSWDDPPATGSGGRGDGEGSAGKPSAPSTAGLSSAVSGAGAGAMAATGGAGTSGSAAGSQAGSAAAGDSVGGGAAGAPGGEPCAECAALSAALVHRYDFEGTGSAVMDRVGTKHGSVVGGATLGSVSGKGAVVLAGGAAGSYVDLPNGVLSVLSNATLEAWVTWQGGQPWQRIFDFGDSTSAEPEDDPASGKSYLFLTPLSDPNSGGALRAVFSLTGGAAAAETRVDGVASLPLALCQVVVVVDATKGALTLYQDGVSVNEQAFSGSLGDINDVNAWLGRSQYEADPELSGTFHDFRIYDAALTPAQIAASFAGGPDPAFLAE